MLREIVDQLFLPCNKVAVVSFIHQLDLQLLQDVCENLSNAKRNRSNKFYFIYFLAGSQYLRIIAPDMTDGDYVEIQCEGVAPDDESSVQWFFNNQVCIKLSNSSSCSFK